MFNKGTLPLNIEPTIETDKTKDVDLDLVFKETFVLSNFNFSSQILFWFLKICKTQFVNSTNQD